ncbi:unnamed protein product [Vicia faba]|uniref:Ubiquitin-like protease family profile domain-containing protein n=1 Tax=Vicia faba TaxID=3906 RepID=A0AAV0Z0H2_VICFA|nr:unnamed protein product [Vicia faba]
MIKHGLFDGLLGFSQGAILSGALPGLQEKGVALRKVPKVKFLIIIGGAKFLEPSVVEKAYSSKIGCPSLHFIVVVFCSIHREIDQNTKKIITNSFAIHQMTNGNRKKATWLHPNTRQQHNSNDCGYYVMKNMLDIVSDNITENWMQVFDDPTELTQDDLYDLRLRWEKCFFELYKN